ncbi:MAG: rhamnulokinase, partial [candidate division Zixibacteria bacterium]|nr:rhamnulokinase [candidate division Zixibacteria bacterium]
NRLRLDELHRFPNAMVRVHGHLHWDALRLYSEILQGMRRCTQDGYRPISMGIDTWGVDFALTGPNRTLLGNPYAYRDPHTEGVMNAAFERVSKETIFEQTGIQFMPINTLYHLIALVRAESPLIAMADRFLMMPDLFNFFLTGVQAVEFSNATTTQCYDPRAGGWAVSLLETFGIPARIMPEIIPPGTILGPILPDAADETGLDGLTVVAPATHDTGSAVAAVPSDGEDWAYLSSGTWSLMGIESLTPIIDADALAFNMTNEGGVGGTFRILKNIAGLWLIQECRRMWIREGDTLSYDDIVAQAEQTPPFTAFVDPDAPAFLNPPHMPDAIRDFCRQNGQPIPETKGQVARVIFESLAFKYRLVLDQLTALHGKPITVLHVVGGGAQNRLLCQFTANATGVLVVAGPVEATAVGNVLVQAMAHGAVADVAQIRDVVRRSFPMGTYTPEDRNTWENAYTRFRSKTET